MEALRNEENDIGAATPQELNVLRWNAFLEIDIDTLDTVAKEAKDRASTADPGSDTHGLYVALALGCETDIERLYKGA